MIPEGLTLYHRAVRDVRGDHLLPLSTLRERYPDVYAREAAKYVGREALMQERVGRLDCRWTEVLFFSPVNPGPLLDAVRQTGRAIPPIRYWTLDAAQLDPARACIYLTRPWPGGVKPAPDPADELPFTPQTLREHSAAPAATLARLRALPDGAPLILWLDVPHVLYRGEVPLSALGEVRC